MTTFDAIREGLGFIESARWHDGHLYYSDVSGRTVQRLAPTGRWEEVVRIDDEPGGLGFAPDGALLVGTMERPRLLRHVEGEVETVVDLASLAVGRTNDLVTDAAGRTYVGMIGPDVNGRMPLLRIDDDGTTATAAEDLQFPNGVAITDDGRLMVLAETLGHRLTAFDVDVDTGDLRGRRPFAQLDDGVYPDGICLDEDGCVWMANPVGRELLRVADGGDILERHQFGDRPLSCVFGGPDRRTLYVLTVSVLDIETAGKEGSGRVLTAEIDVAGSGRP